MPRPTSRAADDAVIKAQIVELIPDRPTSDQMIEIAAAIGCSVKTVNRYASKLGYVSRLHKLPAVEVVIGNLQAGQTPPMIARRHGVSKTAVYRCLLRNGYQLRRSVIFKLPSTHSSDRISA